MAKVKRSEEKDGRVYLMFKCPGCGDTHSFNVGAGTPSWQWNGNLDRPTISPSLLVRCGHYVPNHEKDECWCSYNKEHPDDPAPFVCYLCHSFIRDGRIQFLSDCSHLLAGQTVELPEIEL